MTTRDAPGPPAPIGGSSLAEWPLPDSIVCAALDRIRQFRVRRYRDLEYLCRAYLQFGPDAMSAEDRQKLLQMLCKLGKSTETSAPAR